MNLPHLAALALICALPSISHAAGFDCNKARSTSEKLICADSELSALDDKLTSVAKAAYDRSSDRKALRKSMVDEWKKREETCQDKACLLSWYNRRIAQLSAPDGAAAVSTAAGKEVESLAASLQREERQAAASEADAQRNRDLMAAAEKKLEELTLAAAWEFFNELKAQGVNFSADFRLPTHAVCQSSKGVTESRAGGQFIVYNANCDQYIWFQPKGSKHEVVLSVGMVFGNKTIKDIRYQDNCKLYTIGMDKTYACPEVMKPGFQVQHRQDLRKGMTNTLAGRTN